MSLHALRLPAPAPPLESPTLRPTLAPAPAPRARGKTRRPIWLAIHLRDWQLHAALARMDAQARQTLFARPLAVVDEDRRATVLACNSIAHARGVRRGHSLNASIALCADIQLLPRDANAEGASLEQLATHCERYTSSVSIEPPNELLLEIRGSLKLFGGLDALLTSVSDDLTAQALSPQIALASTPQSALWFSRAASRPLLVRPRELVSALGQLRISYLLWPPEIELRLARFGVLNVSDLLRLPRAGLARRIGYEHLAQLDQALGRTPQLRRHHRSQERYYDRALLDFEIETTGLLSAVVEQRFARLNRFLTRRSLATDHVLIELKHRDHPSTPVHIGLAQATSDTTHIAKLMHEHLAKLALPAPVSEFSVRIDRLHACSANSRDLFSRQLLPATSDSGEAQARLLEQFRSRFESESVRQLVLHADHRPEFANSNESARIEQEHSDAQIPASLAARPLWLLPTPRELSRQRPQILSGPEIIESGWWDGAPIHRSYFIARSAHGALAWIFQSARNPQRTFVHGLFG